MKPVLKIVKLTYFLTPEKKNYINSTELQTLVFLICIFRQFFYMCFIRVLITKNGEYTSRTTNGYKRKLASGKIFDLYKNTPRDTQSVKS